jgi:hypothetical protein
MSTLYEGSSFVLSLRLRSYLGLFFARISRVSTKMAQSTSRRIVGTANGFLTFLGGYSIFQGPIVAIMLVDYFVLRRGNLDLPALFTPSLTGKYYYFYGVNPRAAAAFICGFALPLAGFVSSFDSTGTAAVGQVATRMFDIGWILSFVMGGSSYYVLGKIWPKAFADDFSYGWEGLAREDHSLGGPLSGERNDEVEEQKSVEAPQVSLEKLGDHADGLEKVRHVPQYSSDKTEDVEEWWQV